MINPDDLVIEWDEPYKSQPATLAERRQAAADWGYDLPTEEEPMAQLKKTIDVNLRLNLVPIENDDLLILRGVFGEQEVEQLLNALIAKAERDGGKIPTVVSLAPGLDIEHMDEEAMRNAGWVRPADAPPVFNPPNAHTHTVEPVDEALLRSTMNAAVWAEEFKKVEPSVDEGLMLTWFANAIETTKSCMPPNEAWKQKVKDAVDNVERDPLLNRDRVYDLLDQLG